MPSWTNTLQKSPEGHRIRGLGTLFCQEFSPDGVRLATGGNLGVVLWDIRARRVLGRLAREVAPIVSIAFSRDGRRIAALGQDGAIALCDASTFETIAVVGALQEEMDAEDAPRLHFGADAETLLVMHDEGSWLVSGKKAKMLSGGEDDAPLGDARVVGFSSAGEIVVIEDEAVAFLSKKKSRFERVREIAFAAAASLCVVSGDGRFMFAGEGGAGEHAIVSLETGDVLARRRFEDTVCAVRFAFRAPTVLVDVYEAATLITFPERAGGEVRERQIESVGISDQWIVAPNGDLLVSGDSYYGKISFRDIDGREPFPPLGRYIYDADSGVSLSVGDARASHAVIAGFIGDGQNSSTWVQIFDLVEDRPGAVITESAAFFMTNIAHVPGTDLVAVPLDGGGLALGDVRTGETRILREDDSYQNAAVGMNGAIVASGSGNGYLTFWDRESGRVLACVRAHRDQICGLGWQPNGDLLASSSQDGTVRFWSAKAILAAGKIRDEGPDNECEEPIATASIGDMLYCVVFSPDGQHCAVGMAEGAACVIRASDAAIVRRVGKHRAEVMALAFHPRTGELVTGSSDGTLSVWNPMTGECVFSHSYKGRDGDDDGMTGVTGLGFDAVGSVLVLSHMDGTIRVWDI